MAFQYTSVEDAIGRGGLRMMVVSNIPSPWGEAAKGFLHVKGIDWHAVRLVYDSDALKDWAGQLSAPVAIHDREAPRSGWMEILELVERLVPEPALLPADRAQRDQVLDLSRDFCGESGLGWSRRLQLIHAGLQGDAGFPERVAKYLGRKYGYSPEAGAAAGDRAAQLLGVFAARLKSQQAAGSAYYVGDAMTAADVYGAAFMALFQPLPAAQCAMDPLMRSAFESRDARTEAALDSILFAHRDRLYAEHLELPLSL